MTKSGHSYTAPRTAEAEKNIKALYEGPKFVGPVNVSITFTAEETHVSIESTDWSSPVRADIDNLIKLVLDGLNGCAWDDDKQVVEVQAWKT